MPVKKKTKSTAKKNKSASVVVESLDSDDEVVVEKESKSSKSNEDVKPTQDEKSTKDKKPTKDSGLVKIELNYPVEFDGRYFRGVQEVDKDIAEQLLELDKQKTESLRRR